jgi:hypothetical protein
MPLLSFVGRAEDITAQSNAPLSIVAREYSVNVGKAAQIVIGNAAQLSSSAIMHNTRLAPLQATDLTVRCLLPPFRATSLQLHAAARP